MTERATFRYTGPEQEIRLGSETFRRDREVLVTDPGAIKEARRHPEVSEQGPEGWTTPAADFPPDDPATGGAMPKEEPGPVSAFTPAPPLAKPAAPKPATRKP